MNQGTDRECSNPNRTQEHAPAPRTPMMCILCCLHHGERKWQRTREAQTEQRLTLLVCGGQTTGLQARGRGNSASLTRIRLLRLKPWQRLPRTCVSDS